MNIRLKIVVALSLSALACSTAFAAKMTEQDKADASQVNSACAQDAQTAGCSGMVVGKGLMKCLDNYKKTNKSFQISAGCQAARKQLATDRKAGK